VLLTIREFIELAGSGMSTLADRLQDETGRFGEEEVKAWRASLPLVAQTFKRADLGGFHVQLGSRSGNLALEYRLPAASSWCDMVLLGRGESAPVALMVELKHWDIAGDQPGPRPGLVLHQGRPMLHPSEQVRGYAEYCQRFHSTVLEHRAEVSGLAWMTAANDARAYSAAPHDGLVSECPLFTVSSNDLEQRLPEFLRDRLRKPDPGFARSFSAGVYRQDRDFVRALAATLLDSRDALVLLDHQRAGFELCLQAAENLLQAGDGGKAVLFVEGPPGSGKSVLAARLWAALARSGDYEGDLVFVTTSSSQKTNWKAVFERYGKHLGASGVVVPANEFNPGLDGRWVRREKDRGRPPRMEEWRQNLDRWRRQGGTTRIEDDSIAVAVVDEAHALIDPTVPGGAGNSHSGWSFHAGPQVWHILRASRLAILFFDPEQSFRDNETTTEEAVIDYAREHGATVLPKISLAGAQFRCAGSKEYVEWVERLLAGESHPGSPSRWREAPGRRGFTFELVEDPGALDEALRPHVEAGRSVRLVAAYGREWKTKDVTLPHRLPASERDFCIHYRREGRKRTWARVWNYAPNLDYTLFVQAPEASPLEADVLSEVGCPYVVRGFDFDYIGLLWLSDLVWRRDRWVVQIDHVHETAWRKSLAAAKREARAGIEGPAHAELLRRSVRGYRILLTRPIRGAYIWCEDPETREHLAAVLAES
jgi:hypothetical protein